jgi:hypothetical protein
MRRLLYIFILIIIIASGIFIFVEYKKMPNALNANNQNIAGVATGGDYAQIKKTGGSYNGKTKRENNIRVAIKVGRDVYEISAPEGSTAYDTMKILASTTPAFSFKDKYYSGLGYFIEEINGVKNSDSVYWTLYVNGKYSTVGASQYKILEGDMIEWKNE